MAAKPEMLDWSDPDSIKTVIPTAKRNLTRKCTAIANLIKRPFIHSTLDECAIARQRLHDAYDHCVELHNTTEVLASRAGDADAASKRSAESLDKYEEKYYKALEDLDNYVKNSTAAPATEAKRADITPTKFTACKVLFPEPLSQSRSPEDFRLWVTAFRRFYKASDLGSQDLATQQGYLLTALEYSLRKKVERKIETAMPIFGPGSCMDILEAEFRILYPIFTRRLEFFQAVQDPGEDPKDLLERLEGMGDMADIATLNQDELTAFRFITACTDNRLRDKLFELKRKDMATIKAMVHQHAQQLRSEACIAGKAIAAVTPQPAGNKPGTKRPQRSKRSMPQRPPEMQGRCDACGSTTHKAPTCKVRKDKTRCTHCGKLGHLAKVCYAALAQQGKQAEAEQLPVNALNLQCDSDHSDDEVWKRLTLTITHPSGCFKFATFPDTGSATTLLASDVAERHGIKPSGPAPSTKYVNVSGDTVPVTGTATIQLSSGSHTTTTKAIISPTITNEIIIGRGDLQKLGIISPLFPKPIYVITQKHYDQLKNRLIRCYPKVITDDLPDGAMQGCVMKIHLTPGEKKQFRITTARQVPLHWKDKAERIVNKLLREKVIARQVDPTEWCAPGFFVVKKNGDLRLVVDYTQLNKHVRRPIHTFPSTQEILAGLDPESRVFAKLDATQGYHQIPLEEESSKLTTFLLPSGRFRYLRAPMGLSCSSDEFCRRSDEVVEGLQGVRKLVDDILIQAPDITTLTRRIEELIARCKKHNFTLSRRKLEIGEAVEFAGQIVSMNGVAPNPKFLQGIRDFPAPTSLQELRSFLGMVNQLASYHPGIAKHTGPLQTLLKKDVAFLWLEDHQHAFDKLKTEVLHTLSLNHFDPKWSTNLITDASRLHGMGFVLSQTMGSHTKVIQCGSRTLSPAEKNYSIVELELAAIVWAIGKCRFYLKGIEKFHVLTDHRPLIGIFAKPLPQINNSRVARLREKIIDYAFDTKWVAGKDNVIADALSRAPATSTAKTTGLPIRACIAAPRARLQQIVEAANDSEAYQAIIQAFDQAKDLKNLPCDHPARRLQQVWNSISRSEEGLLLVDGSKIYMPEATRQATLDALHEGHCGFHKTLRTAREIYYWPSLRQDIMAMVTRCEACQSLKPSQPVEPFIHTTAQFPMEMISIDLFHVGRKNYVVIADRYSGYIWVEQLRDLSTKAIIKIVDTIATTYGIPMSCRTDGGPQFRGPFKDYCNSKGIVHEVSSPYNPQSNGHAEAAVKAAKHLLLKTSEAPSRFPEALAAWRGTARHNKPSPNEMFFGRKIRDKKPVVSTVLIPNHAIPNSSPSISAESDKADNKQRSKFHPGDNVRVQNQATMRWDTKAKVDHVSDSGRTLQLTTTEGVNIRRNRRYVKAQCAVQAS